jgi:sugar/nucleoside kinase (ribokinase family)
MIMAKIIVAGLANIETTHKVAGFPIEYEPVQRLSFGLRSTVAGIGYNISKALKTLGNEVDFVSMLGDDANGKVIRAELKQQGISDEHVLSILKESPQASIFYEEGGKRMVFTDRKDAETVTYPLEMFQPEEVDLAILVNLKFTRPMLKKAKEAGIPIAIDVQVVKGLEDENSRVSMEAADILFMSDEGIAEPETWMRQLWERYGTSIIAIGMGSKGALLGVKADNVIVHVPAKSLRPVVNTVGAGDALFSAFIHCYLESKDPYLAMKKAVLFAGYKIGAVGAAEGFMTAADLEAAFKES